MLKFKLNIEYILQQCTSRSLDSGFELNIDQISDIIKQTVFLVEEMKKNQRIWSIGVVYGWLLVSWSEHGGSLDVGVSLSYMSWVCLHESQNGADMVGLWVLACLVILGATLAEAT